MERFISYIIALLFRYTFVRQAFWSAVVLVAVVMITIIIFRGSEVSTQTVGWEKSFPVSSFKITAKNTGISSRGNYIAAVYEGKEEENKGIYASLSFNGGGSFLPPVKIAGTGSKIDTKPHVAVSSGGIITVAWHEFIEQEYTARMFCSTSRDMGANWSPPKRIEIGFDTEMIPRVYYDDRSVLHLFFHGHAGESFNLYHATSVDGERFTVIGPIIELAESLIGAFFPSIHVSGSNVFIVWQGRGGTYTDDLFFIKSEDYGMNWSGRRQLTRSSGSSGSPTSLLHNNVLYVAYQNNENKNWEIRLLQGLYGGLSWELDTLKVSGTNVNCYAPEVVSSGNDVMVLWYDAREGKENIYARKFLVKDNKFTGEVKLSVRDVPAKHPAAVSVGNKVVAFWQEAGIIMGKFSDVHVDPPVLFSTTHPEGVWSNNPVAYIQWKAPKDDSGIVAYWTLETKRPDPRPFVDPPIPTIDGNVTKKIIPNLEDGVTYFHIRAEDGAGNLSRTVHYRIQVSINPLPMPVVVSPTHPQGKAMPLSAPLLRWTVDDTERLKGFYYSLSKDPFSRPDTFSTDFESAYKNLEEGRYFFRIAAVDKTNKLSEILTYDFIVGRAEEMDPDLYRKIADADKKILEKTEKKEEKKEKIAVIGPAVPRAFVNFPFNVNEAYGKRQMTGIIVTVGIPKENVLGYAVMVDRDKRPFPRTINLKNPVLQINDLTSGSYFVEVKCKYFRQEGGKRLEFWTDPDTTRITVRITGEESPFESYLAGVYKKFMTKSWIASLFMISVWVSIVTIGFGKRISFGARVLHFRTRNLLQRFLKSGEA